MLKCLKTRQLMVSFYDYLEEFCTTMQQAQVRDEILLRRPFTDDEEGRTYFRLKDFEAHLRKNKFFEYKSHKIAQRLRGPQWRKHCYEN